MGFTLDVASDMQGQFCNMQVENCFHCKKSAFAEISTYASERVSLRLKWLKTTSAQHAYLVSAKTMNSRLDAVAHDFRPSSLSM
jgi:hypothetical protein